jgi:Domain of unknown function (DUF4209)
VFGSPPTELQPTQGSAPWLVFQLLQAATSPRLKAEAIDEPLAPLAVFPDFRTVMVQDFTAEQLDLFEQIAATIQDAELRARLADIVWVRRRNHRLGELAVHAYLESAAHLEDPINWPDCASRIERALRIALLLGRDKPITETVVSTIEGLLSRYDGNDPLFLSARMMELLLDHRRGDPLKYGPLAEKAAKRAASESDWHRARTYWHLAQRWHNRAKDDKSAQKTGLQFAETFVKQAEQSLSGASPSYMAAVHHLEGAIQALRKLPRTATRRSALHKKLLEYQSRSLGEFKPIDVSVDISRFVKRAKDLVRGKPFIESLIALGQSSGPRKLDQIREDVKEAASQFPLQHLFPTKYFSPSGKVVGRRGSALPAMVDETNSAVRGLMITNVTQMQQIFAEASVVPAVEQINLEHAVSPTDFLPILLGNPFVPSGRELIYAQGLYSGLVGDYLPSTHLIVPQIENSIRFVLNSRDVVTSSYDDFGTQDEFDLNRLFDLPALTAVFGPDLVFDLQCALTEHLGANLRNRVAHGLLSYNEFHSTQSVYLWWITLHLLCRPIERPREQETQSNQDTGKSDPRESVSSDNAD